MRLIGGLAIAVLVVPFFFALALLAGFITWLRRGGPDVVFAMWQIMLYFYDRYLIVHVRPRWTYHAIKSMDAHWEASHRLSRNIPPRWVWQRALDTYGDQISGPISAI